MAVGRQSFGGLPQQGGDRGIVRHDEGGKQLRHVGNAAPFVACEQSDGIVLLIQDI